jgi:hypothetical protein
MVKYFIALLFATSLMAQQGDMLTQKIQNLLSPSLYSENRGFVRVIFEPKSAYYRGDRVNTLKVIQTLKENGLLKLSFNKPTNFTIHFKTSGSPLFFVKVVGDALQGMGYFRYMTTGSENDASEFTWSISFVTEYATDPLLLQKQLQKSRAYIVDVTKKSKTEWVYTIDISHARLNVKKLNANNETKLRHSLYAYWLDVSSIRSLNISSSARNRWYPYIAFYDSSLHLIKLLKEDRVTRKLSLDIPINTAYMKLTDIYTLKNVKDLLLLTPRGTR